MAHPVVTPRSRSSVGRVPTRVLPGTVDLIVEFEVTFCRYATTVLAVSDLHAMPLSLYNKCRYATMRAARYDADSTLIFSCGAARHLMCMRR